MVKINPDLKDIQFVTIHFDGDKFQTVEQKASVLSHDKEYYVSNDAIPCFDKDTFKYRNKWNGKLVMLNGQLITD